ncbi:TetR family transcriptional regulator [Bordetella ansorpii]|uniref:TetR family transcriptional regulator n=1 Tax=Bordetella ansorpii TaxID=288768 RepID=A0A157PNC9_9BORD|nr:TetR/AcrR family transcriptional regulator [Bordetella ansorpii]SAI34888.1 TetR family transcriptional regulator [Bordetella ansorpii]
MMAPRRQAILEAAQRVFARDGLPAATMRAIAKEAGCTTGAIYPCFTGKEEIYAALLRDSLDRLRRHLAQERQAATRPRHVIQAFFDYYAQRQTEFSLGMYLFQGMGPHGLGRETDEDLNGRLAACVDELGSGLATQGAMHASAARLEQMNVFTYLMGLLLLFHTRRLKSLNQQAQPLLDRFCDTLEQRQP